MPPDDVRSFARLVEEGFAAVGFRGRVDLDGDCVSAHDVFAEFGADAISCFEVSRPDAPFRTFPRAAVEAAAIAVCSAVLSRIASRAIELASAG